MFSRNNIQKFVASLNDDEVVNLYAALSMYMFPYMQKKDALGSAMVRRNVLRGNLVKELTKIMEDGPNRVPLDLGY